MPARASQPYTPGLAGLERGGWERSPWLVAGHSLPSRAGQPWPRWGRGSDRNSLLTTLGSWVLAGCRPRRDTRRTRRQLQGLGARSLERGTCGDERPPRTRAGRGAAGSSLGSARAARGAVLAWCSPQAAAVSSGRPLACPTLRSVRLSVCSTCDVCARACAPGGAGV